MKIGFGKTDFGAAPAGSPGLAQKKPMSQDGEDLVWFQSKLPGPYPEESFRWIFVMARLMAYLSVGGKLLDKGKNTNMDIKATSILFEQTLPHLLGVRPDEREMYRRFLKTTLNYQM